MKFPKKPLLGLLTTLLLSLAIVLGCSDSKPDKESGDLSRLTGNGQLDTLYDTSFFADTTGDTSSDSNDSSGTDPDSLSDSTVWIPDSTYNPGDTSGYDSTIIFPGDSLDDSTIWIPDSGYTPGDTINDSSIWYPDSTYDPSDTISDSMIYYPDTLEDSTIYFPDSLDDTPIVTYPDTIIPWYDSLLQDT